jgi:hypothetical protein
MPLPDSLKPRTPNFFIAGAAKSGTTSVARYLEEHPQVYMSPIKEPSYFARDIIPSLQPADWSRNQRGLEKYLNGPMRERRGGCVLDWESYLKLFGNVMREIAIGEASTAYLISPKAPLDIRAAIPNARIIIMLRSHVERAFSAYLMLCRNGRLRASFSDIIRSESTGGLTEWKRMILEICTIAPGMDRFLTTFPRDQIRWYFHEEFSSRPLDVMRSIYEFLGVDPGFSPNVRRRHNEGLLPKAPVLHRISQMTGLSDLASRFTPKSARPFLRRILFHTGPNPRISVEDRALLVEHFREDVERLSNLVERDLSHWLRLD